MDLIDIGGFMIKWPEDWFEQFWKLYPRRVAKKAALHALDRHRRAGGDFSAIMAGVKAYADFCRGKEVQFICHPATWINGERWEDELAQPTSDTSWKLNRAMEETMRRRMQ